MEDIFNRNKLLIGNEGQSKLQQAHVVVVGIGGVGSYTAEALARAGIGSLTLIDHDCVDITNINRQLHATHKTIGQLKVEAMAQRISDINPNIQVLAKPAFILAENIAEVLTPPYDYIVDAIDTVSAKLALVQWAKQQDIPIICSMGTANKLDNMHFEVVDISQTAVCPLARVMRRELKQRGITTGIKVVYSPTPVIKPVAAEITEQGRRRQTPGSISYVPGTAGLIIAGVVIRHILEIE